MTMTELFSAELEREAAATRRVLERVPEGRYDWKPHERSMTLGRLSSLVATMPSWVEMMVDHDSLDLARGGTDYEKQNLRTPAALVSAHDTCVAEAKESLARTSDEHLMTTLAVAGGRQDGQREPAPYHAARFGVQPPGASPRPADGLPAPDGGLKSSAPGDWPFMG